MWSLNPLDVRLLVLVFSLVYGQSEDNRYALNILHYNDFHARFVETSPWGTICNPETAPCIGGFARLTTLVRQRMAAEPQSLLLNGGDSFQGTIWYNILRWNVTQEFMNLLPHDAHVLGNHEFDNGIEGVVPYLQYLNSSVVTANIIDDDEPTIQGLYYPSIVVEKNGRRIGIIGVIIASTHTLASTGDLKFTDEVETVKAEAEKLNADGVDIIIVLSHCGLDIDREIALHAGPYIDIIVGGHSHTLLYNGEIPVDSGWVAQGPYPVVVEQPERKVLIVQAAAHTAYLGEIKLFFDDAGNLLDWEGHPHYVANEIEQAPDVLEKINKFLPMIEELASEEIGHTMVHLSSSCACGECNLGSFICDAFMHSVLDWAEGNNWHYAHFCVINQGGIRAGIDSGVITFESTILSTPFENNVEVFDMRGDHILEMLEYSVANEPYAGARMLQVSGLRAVFDGSRPLNDRVVNATIRCINCDIPRYEPLKHDKFYKIVSQAFIGGGGDGFHKYSNFATNINNVEIKSKYYKPTSIAVTQVLKPHYHYTIIHGIVYLNRNTYSGIRTVFDGSRPVGDRVLNVSIRCIECSVPRYEPLVLDKHYKMMSSDFIGQGGGDYTMISENRRNVEVVGVDYDILMNYIRHQSPVLVDLDGRIQITDPCVV